jgi:hypothetical protein
MLSIYIAIHSKWLCSAAFDVKLLSVPAQSAKSKNTTSPKPTCPPCPACPELASGSVASGSLAGGSLSKEHPRKPGFRLVEPTSRREGAHIRLRLRRIQQTSGLKFLYSVYRRRGYGEERNKSGYFENLLDVIFHGTEYDFSIRALEFFGRF